MTKKLWSFVWAAVVLIIVAQIFFAMISPYMEFIKITFVCGAVIAAVYFVGKRARAVLDRR